MLRTFAVVVVGVTVLAAGCRKESETDRTATKLKQAVTNVDKQQTDLTATQEGIERTKRELIQKQQDLEVKQKSLEVNQQDLGTALGTLTEARTAYRLAVDERLAKLDAAIASRATQTDAASIDLVAGLHARRDLLATTIAQMAATPDPDWTKFTHDVDATFDAIEHDLR